MGRREHKQETQCGLCCRIATLTFHHLIPLAVHRKKRYLNRFGKEEMQRRGLMLCNLCHNAIHEFFPDEKVLADHFHTKELLVADARMAKHIEWARKQK